MCIAIDIALDIALDLVIEIVIGIAQGMFRASKALTHSVLSVMVLSTTTAAEEYKYTAIRKR